MFIKIYLLVAVMNKKSNFYVVGKHVWHKPLVLLLDFWVLKNKTDFIPVFHYFVILVE